MRTEEICAMLAHSVEYDDMGTRCALGCLVHHLSDMFCNYGIQSEEVTETIDVDTAIVLGLVPQRCRSVITEVALISKRRWIPHNVEIRVRTAPDSAFTLPVDNTTRARMCVVLQRDDQTRQRAHECSFVLR